MDKVRHVGDSAVGVARKTEIDGFEIHLQGSFIRTRWETDYWIKDGKGKGGSKDKFLSFGVTDQISCRRIAIFWDIEDGFWTDVKSFF